MSQQYCLLRNTDQVQLQGVVLAGLIRSGEGVRPVDVYQLCITKFVSGTTTIEARRVVILVGATQCYGGIVAIPKDC